MMSTTTARCTVGSCTAHALAFGLCDTHYGRLRRAMIREGDWFSSRRDRSTQIACKCRQPKWDTCGPFFPHVVCCRWCGSPAADQFGKAFS